MELERDITSQLTLNGLPHPRTQGHSPRKEGIFWHLFDATWFVAFMVSSPAARSTSQPLFKVFPLPFGFASTYSSHSLAFIVSLSAAS